MAGALTSEHRDARLRTMAASPPHEALVRVLHQIHDGVDAAVWADMAKRTPDLTAPVDGEVEDPTRRSE